MEHAFDLLLALFFALVIFGSLLISKILKSLADRAEENKQLLAGLASIRQSLNYLCILASSNRREEIAEHQILLREVCDNQRLLHDERPFQ